MKKGTKAIIWVASILVFLLFLLPLLAGGCQRGFRSWVIPLYKWGFSIKDTPQTSAAATTNDSATAESSSTTETMALNESTSVDPLQDPLWNDYYKCGVQIDDDQSKTVWYVQSGKDGTVEIKGSVPKDQVLAIDALTMIKDGSEYYDGNILLLRGPVDLDKYNITITNGAAQLVPASHVQEFLDYNMAVKFARGDWNEAKGQFSYSPWALSHVWVLDYTYNSLVGKLTAENDNYPR